MTPFIEQSLIFIGAAILFVPLFQRLGFGSILGYLLAGVLVGPQGLKLIRDVESASHLSELGVVLLLFVIGLEIQPRKLWSMRNHLLGLGGMQIALSTAVFVGGCWVAGLTMPTVLVIGLALSLSSTAFAVQSLTEKNQFNTEFGRASFSVLLMQDLVAIPALAIIPALGVTSGVATENSPSYQSVGLGLLIIVFLVTMSRYFIRPLFRLIASTRSREIFTGATLFIVLGVAALMQAVGLSAALGTFIAGVLLSESEYRHELEANLDPFKSLLMGLFFIAVGMSVSLDRIFHAPLFMLAITLGYLGAKLAAGYIVGRTFKLDHINSKKMALTIAQGGEFAFVIFALIAKMSLASTDTIEILTAMITLSMALNPLIQKGDEWITARRQKMAPAPQYDDIQNESPSVIIAGFGRFGQIFARMLRAQAIPFVAIDHDSNQVELARKFGSKVYYGDASRKDLLEAAGIGRAKYFVLAIDHVEHSLNTARLITTEFPHIKVFARARNRGHVFDLMEIGVHAIKRETIDSSIAFVGDLLKEMGMQEKTADLLIERFRTHDEIMLQDQFKVRRDDDIFVSVSKQAAVQLAQILNEESTQTRIDFAE